jgi:ABC-type multidrug transport system ATPase subunit
VREALRFSAALQQPRARSSRQTLDEVESVLNLLALRDVADHLLGIEGKGLSPLQSRKAFIGMELVAGPAILFVEYPTLGLDLEAALNIMCTLRRVAATGAAICMSFEQQPSPEILNVVDTVVVLTKHGKQAYFGPVEGLGSFSFDAGTAENCCSDWVESRERHTLVSELVEASSQLVPLESSFYRDPKSTSST